MIVTKPKLLQETLDKLATLAVEDVLVVGCGGCATTAGTGGEPEAAVFAEKLVEAGYSVDTVVPEATCNVGIVKIALRETGSDPDAIVVLSCGSGVQVVADLEDETPTIAGLDSMFLGNSIRVGEYEQRCMMCGKCNLYEVGGLCVKTLCPKGISNGPCGGMWEGRCEVLEDRACVHVMIHERLSKQGRFDDSPHQARNHGGSPMPRSHSTRVRKGR